MTKLFSALFICSILFGSISFAAVDATKAETCVLQLSKSDNENSKPSFVIACGSETVLAHELPGYTAIADKDSFKLDLASALVSMMGEDASIYCTQAESDYFWILICKR